jgi:hypothetical protein
LLSSSRTPPSIKDGRWPCSSPKRPSAFPCPDRWGDCLRWIPAPLAPHGAIPRRGWRAARLSYLLDARKLSAGALAENARLAGATPLWEWIGEGRRPSSATEAITGRCTPTRPPVVSARVRVPLVALDERGALSEDGPLRRLGSVKGETCPSSRFPSQSLQGKRNLIAGRWMKWRVRAERSTKRP